jgi:hypothetical protein
MRNIPTAFFNALNNVRDTGAIPRQFAYFTAKNRSTGSPVYIGFWKGDEDITISVVNPFTGLQEGRTYFGAQNLNISEIVRVTDMTTQTINVSLSQISPAAQQLFRDYDIRLAKVEIHEILLDTNSRQPVATPIAVFIGEVNASPVTTPAIGEDGSLSIDAVSDAIAMLSISNPAKSSAEFNRRRLANDTFGQFAGTVSTWKVPWGTKASQDTASSIVYKIGSAGTFK